MLAETTKETGHAAYKRGGLAGAASFYDIVCCPCGCPSPYFCCRGGCGGVQAYYKLCRISGATAEQKAKMERLQLACLVSAPLPSCVTPEHSRVDWRSSPVVPAGICVDGRTRALAARSSCPRPWSCPHPYPHPAPLSCSARARTASAHARAHGKRARTQTNRALALSKLEDHANAVVACTEALQIDPRSEKALYWRGVARSKLDRFDEAESDLNQVPCAHHVAA